MPKLCPKGKCNKNCKCRKIGTRRQVLNGVVDHTKSGLKKTDLKRVRGRIVSRAKSAQGKKVEKNITVWRQALKNLGYLQKGSFRKIPRVDTPKYYEIKDEVVRIEIINNRRR